MKIVIRNAVMYFMLAGSLSLQAQDLHLFNSEIRDAADYPHQVVMDFIERYFGKELQASRQTTLEHKMADDKVYFRKGTIKDLSLVTDTMPFSISLHDKYYEVKWERESLPFITLVFPAQYDLLLGMQKDEAVNQLEDAIVSAPSHKDSVYVPYDLQPLPDSIWQHKTEHFELESLNDAIYYNKVRDRLVPVFDARQLEYSAVNLFHGLIPGADYRMYVEQSVYGMKTINYSVTLQQWLNYCAQLKMKIFFAVEEVRDDGLQAVVLAQSKELGFNHLLSVVIPDKFVTDTNAVLKVRMTPYIPIHNVKDLYQKESTTHKKIKWQ